MGRACLIWLQMAEETLEGRGQAGATSLPVIAAGAVRDRGTPAALRGRLGIDVPQGWWPSAPVLKAVEAAGFGWAQVHSPPSAVLATPRLCTTHAAAVAANLETTGLRTIVHGPNSLMVGSKVADRAFEGLLSWAAEIGAEQVVYHARALVDDHGSESALLFETRSLARLAARAERLGVTIAIENLAPVYPGLELLSANPMTLRGLAHRIGSDRVGICLDLGHAHIVAGLRHTSIEHLVEPVLDVVSLFHVHDNLGARRSTGLVEHEGAFDPLRLDLHLPPGRGNLPWERIAPLTASHGAPLRDGAASALQPARRGRLPRRERAAGLGPLVPGSSISGGASISASGSPRRRPRSDVARLSGCSVIRRSSTLSPSGSTPSTTFFMSSSRPSTLPPSRSTPSRIALTSRLIAAVSASIEPNVRATSGSTRTDSAIVFRSSSAPATRRGR